ncbi:MAG TPA: CheR family methyltransferase [Nitrospiraceae bacterium]|nr:CheR family methyltransferase [Nitrospiraceae bacterium]
MAPTPKIHSRTVPAKTGVEHKSLNRHPVKATRPQVKPTPTTTQPTVPPGFLIVGIGASAGGLEAMEEFFRHMSPSSGMAFVVVSHQHAGHVSLLPSLLSKCTAMPIVEVTDGMEVEANRVYMAPGGINLAMLHGTLHIMECPPENRVPLPIDYFFRSLAEDQKRRAVGIILSGTGSDGTLGLRAIKAESGMTIAQEPQSAKYQGMPRSAIAAGVVDVVKPAGQMSEPLVAYTRSLARPALPAPEHDGSQTLRKIFILLRDRTGNDFALYKENTIHRRIERRMNVHQIENVRQYLRFAQTNPHELDTLCQELLIGVTSFFRDPQAFEALVHKGLPALIEGKSEGATLRLWVAGCSTGEEAYSLAIMLKEYLTQQKRRFTVQIFASDLDGRAIETARGGLYPVGIAGDVTPERLQRFFTKEDHSYRIKKEIRDLVVFAKHNVLTDAPFTKLDLLSCRNLLIYLEAKAQQKLLPLFHYALKPQGILFLGSSESIGGFESFFTVIDRKGKLFRRTAEPGAMPRLERFPGGAIIGTAAAQAEAEVRLPPLRSPSIPDLIQQLLASRYAPAAVVVNERGEVVYIQGHTGTYLEPAPGPPTHHLLEMAREGLQHDLALALHLAARKEDDVVRHDVRMKANGGVILVNVTVKKIAEPEPLEGLFLVTFEQAQGDKPAAGKGAPARAAAPLRKGESGIMRELQFTKQRLQHTIGELQTSNEQLKSTNEELQSTNEELQSTNEELETTKEELQSLNEELVTVNAELQGKVDAIADAHDDLQNLLNGTEVATIFLDNDLRIKRFTTEAKRVSHLIALDVGRPLSDIVSKLSSERLVEEAQHVLQTLVVKEREVQTTDGSWFYMRILPYRTAKNTIDGLVLTFLDISKMKEAERVVEAARSIAASIVETVREPLLVLDEQLRVVSTNQAFYRTFQVTPGEVELQLIYHLCSGAWNLSPLRRLLEEVLLKNTSFQDFIVDETFPHIGRKVLVLNGRRLVQEVLQPGRVLLAMEEVKERERQGEGNGMTQVEGTP